MAELSGTPAQHFVLHCDNGPRSPAQRQAYQIRASLDGEAVAGTFTRLAPGADGQLQPMHTASFRLPAPRWRADVAKTLAATRLGTPGEGPIGGGTLRVGLYQALPNAQQVPAQVPDDLATWRELGESLARASQHERGPTVRVASVDDNGVRHEMVLSQDVQQRRVQLFFLEDHAPKHLCELDLDSYRHLIAATPALRMKAKHEADTFAATPGFYVDAGQGYYANWHNDFSLPAGASSRPFLQAAKALLERFAGVGSALQLPIQDG